MSGWYKTEKGTAFHAHVKGDVADQTIEALGKLADAAAAMAASYRCPQCGAVNGAGLEWKLMKGWTCECGWKGKTEDLKSE